MYIVYIHISILKGYLLQMEHWYIFAAVVFERKVEQFFKIGNCRAGHQKSDGCKQSSKADRKGGNLYIIHNYLLHKPIACITLLARNNHHLIFQLHRKTLQYTLAWSPNLKWVSIRMSHWRHMMVDGAKFWISYQRLAFLSTFGRWQLIQNLAPSTIVLRQCDIRISCDRVVSDFESKT